VKIKDYPLKYWFSSTKEQGAGVAVNRRKVAGRSPHRTIPARFLLGEIMAFAKKPTLPQSLIATPD